MAKYIKHNSNYIRTDIHQFLKGGSTIFERDWVTVGSQLNFGPGKIPYYRDGNFIFTTSMIPRYQKKHKNGVTVATWTYEDVKDASPIVNQIQLDEHTEDIRSYAYYGSCVELLRASIENIINTFPGNITVANEELGVYKTVEEFVCGGEDVEEMYVPLTGYWPLSNPFDINVYLKNVHLTQYDNPLRYLTHSFDKYQVSTNNGGSFSDITSYEVVMRKMYEKVAPPCIETIKKSSGSATLAKNESKTISLSSGKYFIEINNVKKNNWQTLCYDDGESPFFTLTRKAKSVAYVVEEGAESGNIVLTLSNDETQTIDTSSEETVKIYFYKEQKIQRTYKYYQMFDDEQYQETYKAQGWVESTCIMDFWLPDSVFLNRCDEYQRNVLYSELSGIGKNLPVYTVTINNSILIEGYIYNRQVVPLVTNLNLIIQPKEEVIEEYFDNLEGFEKQLLTRKTKPLYTNRFVTPIEYNLGYLYYKRTYTWPSNGYCIDIVSPRYLDFVNKLGKTAELLDELWTDNLWRRMTHEAIKNYDWTYTREFEEGEEQDNVDGGERMHKVINVIGRVFDDVKRTIDTIKRNNKVSYDEDRNMPNALISDKLEIQGWDIYSTIPSYTDEDTGEIVSANEQTVETEFLENKGLEWYPALDSSKMTFADVDIKFMRRLLLSTKRIFQTKGTRHGIDMIMGMFGYGNMDETQPNYTITEEYYHVVPRKYDEPFDENYTFGDKIVYLNEKKDIDRIYYEDASGIPVGSFIGEYDEEGKPITYLIPFYNQNKIYDGYKLYFQTKGGWLYNKVDESEEEPNPYNWTETLSYLHVVPQVKDLFDINPYDIREGDIYYVVNINDYINYTEVELYSNFFVVKNQFMPELLSSWVNLNLNEGFYEDEEDAEKYEEYVKKAIYLDSIIPYTIGNNPHVGYGNYDQGKEYLDYMKKPFKFSIDEKHLIYEDEVDADKINFDKNVSGSTTNENGKPYWVHYPDAVNNEDKIQIFVKGEDEDGVIKKKYDIVNDILNPSETHWGVLDYNTYDMEKAKELIKEKYFLNSKVIHFKNLIQGNNYKLYFREVILKYLMQLIPSTTIFIMEGFELTDDGSGNKPQYRWITASGEYICDGTDKYAKQKRQMSTDGGTTWTDTGQTKKGDLIERNSRDCGYFEPQYRWVDISGDYECVGTDKYAKQKKQVSNDGGRTWRDTGETQRGNLIERNSTDCGYIAPQYRWVNVDNDYVCVGTTKYNKEKKQVSNDGGRTWSDTNETRTGNTVLEQYSTDCGYEALTRWVTIQGEYVCVGTDKYNKEKKQISNDNGTTWVDTTDTRTGTTLIERNSADCGYVVHYEVSFYENETDTRPLHTEQIEEGQPVNNYQNSNWYILGDSNKQPVQFPYIVNGPTKFVRIKEYTVNWDVEGEVIEPTTYNIRFFEKDGTTLLKETLVQKNSLISNYNYYQYYRKNDDTHTVVRFPVCVTQNEEFVRYVQYTVSFFEDETTTTPLDVQYIEDGKEVSPKSQYASYQWYLKGDVSKTVITFPYTVTKTISFVKKEGYVFEFEDGTTIQNLVLDYYSTGPKVTVKSKLGSANQAFTEEHYDIVPSGSWVTNVYIPDTYTYVKPNITMNYVTTASQNRTFKIKLTQQGSGKTLMINITQKSPDVGLIYNMPPIEVNGNQVTLSVDSVTIYNSGDGDIPDGTNVLVGYGNGGRREGRLSDLAYHQYLRATVTVQNGYKVVPDNAERIVYIEANAIGVAKYPFKVSADGRTLTALTPDTYQGEYYTYYNGFIDGYLLYQGTVVEA